jgi:hypothetical protein
MHYTSTLVALLLLVVTSGIRAQNSFPATGNVGIGTTSPTHLLEVKGGWLYTDGTLQVDGGDVYISRTNYGYGYVIRPDLPGYRNLQFAVAGGGPLDYLQLNSRTSFFTGAVGVGTSLPAANLDIYSPGSSSQQQGLFIHSGSFGTGSNAQSSYFIKAQDDGNGATKFVLHGDGSVGINTDVAPGYTLSVNGAGIFTKVVVKPYPWSDYVFDSTYKLAPLSVVEKYIRSHRHLPDVPSSDSVAKGGIDVGSNQAVLLRKVEEMTLYIIGQDKKLKGQGDRMEEQDKRLEEQGRMLKVQEKRIRRLEELVEEKAKK